MSPSPTSTVPPSRKTTAEPVPLYLAGVGAVGSALLAQIERLPTATIRLLGACTSCRSVWEPAPNEVRSRLAQGAPLNWTSVIERLTRHAPRPLVFVDATGSAEVADRYAELLGAGIHVVTPSKIANTGAQARFDRLHAIASDQGVEYRYETTVGAGLPVLQTIRNLIATGDSIHTIRGAASGTLTFLLTELRRGHSFSEAVRRAIRSGYTEPDVRDDLSGEDVARKMLILARTGGRSLEREDVSVESLVPPDIASLSYDSFLNRLEVADEKWRCRSDEAAVEDATLQYVGRFTSNQIDVGVQKVPKHTAFGRLSEQTNLFEITTDRYDDTPLTIKGPGAGPDVTAAGVLSDVLAVARSLPAA